LLKAVARQWLAAGQEQLDWAWSRQVIVFTHDDSREL
jgi:hypothetical protein